MTDNPTDQSASADGQVLSGVDVTAMPRVLSRLARQTLRYPLHVTGAAAAALGAAILNLAMPRLLGRAIDDAHRLLASANPHGYASHHALAATATMIVFVCAARGSLTGLQGYLGESLAQRVGHDLRLAFYSKLQSRRSPGTTRSIRAT